MPMFAKSHHLEVSDSQPNSIPTDEKIGMRLNRKSIKTGYNQ